jgi:hypothetical protein
MRLGVGSQPVAQYVMYVKANVGENANAWLGIDNDNATGSTALRLILNGATTSGFQYVQSTNMTQVYANAGDIQLINGSSLGLTIANTTGAATFSASATATSFVKSGGTSSQFLKADGSVDSTSYGTGTVTSVATSAPLTGGTITTSGTIGITQATTSANGYLSSTDWNTFNGKFTLPSLTSGSVLFSNGSTIAQDNANFFWDDVNNRLGIGTATPESILHILGASAILYIDGNSAGTQTSSTLRLRTGGFNVGNFRYNVATDNIEISNISAGGAVTSGAVKIYGTSGSTTGLTIAAAGEATFSQKIQISTGGLRIGTSATENDRLIVVNGTNLTSGSTQYLEVIAPTYTGNITNLYGRLQYATCNSGTITNAYMMYLGSWSGTSTYSNKWSIYQESTTEKNYFGSTVLIGSATDNGLGKLQVTGAATFSSTATISSDVTIKSSSLLKLGNSDNASTMQIWNSQSGAANNLLVYDNAASAYRFVISSSGLVGIGTSSPAALLETRVAGESPATGKVALIAATSNGINDIFRWFDGTTQLGVFKNNGNVGIGTSLPNRLLEVATSGDTYLRVAGNRGNADDLHVGNVEFYNTNTTRIIAEVRAITGTGGTQSNSGQLAFYTNNAGTYAERMRITSGGLVGINTSAPKTNLQISNVSGADLLSFGISDYQAWVGGKIDLQGISSFGADMVFYTHPANGGNNATVTERMRITSGGDVYLNNGAATFYGTYGSAVTYIAGSSTQITCVVSSGGVKLTSGATSWVSNSDERLKTDLLPISDGLNKVLTLRALTGRLKTDEEGFSRSFLIAQDVQKVLPEAIYEDTDEDKTLGIRYTEVIPLLVSAIQEQQAIITSLQDRLDKLENK